MGLAHTIMAEFLPKLDRMSTESEDNRFQDTVEAEKTGIQSATAHSEETSLLQVSVREQSNAFKMVYSAGN
jgi:hypothetical protein